jgi:uncharacterized protein
MFWHHCFCLESKKQILITMSEQSNKSQDTGKGNTSNRGFASMDEDKQREIASKGGHASHEQGVAHEWDSEEAREAGRKGGQASHSGNKGTESDDDDSGSSKNSGGRGFASMDESKQKDAARKGGEHSHGGKGDSRK